MNYNVFTFLGAAPDAEATNSITFTLIRFLNKHSWAVHEEEISWFTVVWNCTWFTPPTTRRRSLMTMKDVEHRGNAIGDRLSHFFFWGWKASTVSRAVGSWPGQHWHTGAHQRNAGELQNHITAVRRSSHHRRRNATAFTGCGGETAFTVR